MSMKKLNFPPDQLFYPGTLAPGKLQFCLELNLDFSDSSQGKKDQPF